MKAIVGLGNPGGEYAGILSRRSSELDGSRETVLRRAARQGKSRPAE